MTFQSTRHLRGATLHPALGILRHGISIHAPLTWRDVHKIDCVRCVHDFNPRATYVARPICIPGVKPVKVFQSTRHLRGATCRPARPACRRAISIHAPLTWRDQAWDNVFLTAEISIHAPLTWRDVDQQLVPIETIISIHAPLTWRDGGPSGENVQGPDFNPRATYVARPT